MANVVAFYSPEKITRTPTLHPNTDYKPEELTRTRSLQSPVFSIGHLTRTRTYTLGAKSPLDITRARNYLETFNYRGSLSSNNVVAGFGIGGYSAPSVQIVDPTGTFIYAIMFANLGSNQRKNIQWTPPPGVTSFKIRMSKGTVAPTVGNHMIISQPKLEIGPDMTNYLPGPSIVGP